MRPGYISLEPLIQWQALERPVSWTRFFPDSGRLHVEIGFGLGDFLVRQAREHPDWGFIGIEVEWVCIRRTLRKIALAGIRNVRLVRLDARVAFERLFPDLSVAGIDSLFPCPWPKTRHMKNRLFSNDFMKTMNSRLLPGGEARIVTDHRDYFEWILGQSRGTGFAVFSRKMPPGLATKYERKWLDLGQESFFEVRLVKKEHMDVPLKEDMTLKTHRVDHFHWKNFHPSGCRGDIVVEFKDCLIDSSQERGMIRSLVVEDEFRQDFWIEIEKREDHWHIHPAKGCSIIPTAGVQRALDLAREAAERSWP